MGCQKCGSDRIASINGKTSDCFSGVIEGKDYDGYVPSDMGIGGGDDIEFSYCLNCGQIQGKWPVYPDLYNGEEYEEDEEVEVKNEHIEPSVYVGKYNLRRV